MNDPKGGVAKVTCRTFEAMGQIPMFHRTYFLLTCISIIIIIIIIIKNENIRVTLCENAAGALYIVNKMRIDGDYLLLLCIILAFLLFFYVFTFLYLTNSCY